MFEKLKNHLKKHARVYSLGFLALVAVCVSYLYIQVDDLENEQMTGWIGRFSSPTRIAIPSNSLNAVKIVGVGDAIDFDAIKGVLTITASGSPASAIAVAGMDDVLVAKYTAMAMNKSVTIKKLTVINDSAGVFTSPEDTPAVEEVVLSYNGKKVVGSLANGKVTFSNLNINVPRNGMVALDIYANISPMAAVGETLSGTKFRLGLSETKNITETDVVDGSALRINPTFKNSSTVNSFLVKKTKPTFSFLHGNSALSEGVPNSLYSFQAKADPAGSVGLARLVFDVTVNGFDGKDDDINTFQFFRGAALMPNNQYNIVCTMPSPVGPTNVKQFGMNVCDNDDSVGVKDGNYQIIVTFNQEESISAGSSQMYKLIAFVSGRGSITTKLANGDDKTPLTGLQYTNPNMGKLFELGTADKAIFWRDASDFRDRVEVGRNIIWSDRSAIEMLHSFPAQQNTLLQSGSGSYDWTNGYLLGLGMLESHTID